jgi:hypothetical protein
MPRRRGKDKVSRKGPSRGTQFEQQDDALAHSRDRTPRSPRDKQRTSEIAANTPYGSSNQRRKTS